MYRKFVYFIIFYCISLQGSEGQRVRDLLPSIFDIPAINPYLPENFVAIDYSQDPRAQNWIYWGPKEVILDYLKEPSSLKVPIIRLHLSANVTQDQLSDNSFLQDAQNCGFDIEVNRLEWGEYPLLSTKVKYKDQNNFIAWLGLNAEGGHVLMFNLLVPSNKPDKEAIKLWKDFLQKTKPLSGYEMIKAHGQDLQDGYTIVTAGNEQLKFIVEERKADKLLRVVVIPFKGSPHFDLEKVEKVLMGLEWKYKEPIAKVYGTIEAKIAENSIVVQKDVTTILIRSVEDFSWTDDKIKAHSECTSCDVKFVYD